MKKDVSKKTKFENSLKKLVANIFFCKKKKKMKKR